MRAYHEYSKLELKKGLKEYKYKEIWGYILAITWLIVGILPVVRLQGRGWWYVLLVYAPYVTLAMLCRDMAKTSIFHRKFSHNASYQEFERRENQYIVYRKISTLVGLLWMIGWSIWIWKFWKISLFSTIWFIPFIFWAPWLAYTHKIVTIRFFRECKRRGIEMKG